MLIVLPLVNLQPFWPLFLVGFIAIILFFYVWISIEEEIFKWKLHRDFGPDGRRRERPLKWWRLY